MARWQCELRPGCTISGLLRAAHAARWPRKDQPRGRQAVERADELVPDPRLMCRSAEMLPRNSRPLPHRVKMEVASPVTMRLLYQVKLLTRECEIEARIGEVGCERDRIAVENQGSLVFASIMQHVRQVEASLCVVRFMLDRS